MMNENENIIADTDNITQSDLKYNISPNSFLFKHVNPFMNSPRNKQIFESKNLFYLSSSPYYYTKSNKNIPDKQQLLKEEQHYYDRHEGRFLSSSAKNKNASRPISPFTTNNTYNQTIYTLNGAEENSNSLRQANIPDKICYANPRQFYQTWNTFKQNQIAKDADTQMSKSLAGFFKKDSSDKNQVEIKQTSQNKDAPPKPKGSELIKNNISELGKQLTQHKYPYNYLNKSQTPKRARSAAPAKSLREQSEPNNSEENEKAQKDELEIYSNLRLDLALRINLFKQIHQQNEKLSKRSISVKAKIIRSEFDKKQQIQSKSEINFVKRNIEKFQSDFFEAFKRYQRKELRKKNQIRTGGNWKSNALLIQKIEQDEVQKLLSKLAIQFQTEVPETKPADFELSDSEIDEIHKEYAKEEKAQTTPSDSFECGKDQEGEHVQNIENLSFKAVEEDNKENKQRQQGLEMKIDYSKFKYVFTKISIKTITKMLAEVKEKLCKQKEMIIQKFLKNQSNEKYKDFLKTDVISIDKQFNLLMQMRAPDMNLLVPRQWNRLFFLKKKNINQTQTEQFQQVPTTEIKHIGDKHKLQLQMPGFVDPRHKVFIEFKKQKGHENMTIIKNASKSEPLDYQSDTLKAYKQFFQPTKINNFQKFKAFPKKYKFIKPTKQNTIDGDKEINSDRSTSTFTKIISFPVKFEQYSERSVPSSLQRRVMKANQNFYVSRSQSSKKSKEILLQNIRKRQNQDDCKNENQLLQTVISNNIKKKEQMAVQEKVHYRNFEFKVMSNLTVYPQPINKELILKIKRKEI